MDSASAQLLPDSEVVNDHHTVTNDKVLGLPDSSVSITLDTTSPHTGSTSGIILNSASDQISEDSPFSVDFLENELTSFLNGSGALNKDMTAEGQNHNGSHHEGELDNSGDLVGTPKDVPHILSSLAAALHAAQERLTADQTVQEQGSQEEGPPQRNVHS